MDIHVKLTDYGYSCGDGCCYTYGIIVEMGEEKINLPFATELDVMKCVLSKLDINLIIEHDENYD